MSTPLSELKKGKVTPVEFLSRLLNAKNEVHILHLQTDSYAKHMALNDFYNEISEHFDTLCESYQGVYGIVRGYSLPNYSNLKDPITYLKDFLQFVTSNQQVFGDSDFSNIVDEIKTLTKQTLYKLINLK